MGHFSLAGRGRAFPPQIAMPSLKPATRPESRRTIAAGYDVLADGSSRRVAVGDPRGHWWRWLLGAWCVAILYPSRAAGDSEAIPQRKSDVFTEGRPKRQSKRIPKQHCMLRLPRPARTTHRVPAVHSPTQDLDGIWTSTANPPKRKTAQGYFKSGSDAVGGRADFDNAVVRHPYLGLHRRSRPGQKGCLVSPCSPHGFARRAICHPAIEAKEELREGSVCSYGLELHRTGVEASRLCTHGQHLNRT